MHSREGLETPYLSERWMELCRFCAERGPAPWGCSPSSTTRTSGPPAWPAALLRARIPNARRRPSSTSARRTPSRSAPRGAPLVQRQSAREQSLGKESVRAFLDITHEAYRKAFGGTLRRERSAVFSPTSRISGTFSSISARKTAPPCPITDDLPAEFRRRRGLRAEFPRLCFPGAGTACTGTTTGARSPSSSANATRSRFTTGASAGRAVLRPPAL
jgi:hypothetical protein